jgi:hypothetical protein
VSSCSCSPPDSKKPSPNPSGSAKSSSAGTSRSLARPSRCELAAPCSSRWTQRRMTGMHCQTLFDGGRRRSL